MQFESMGFGDYPLTTGKQWQEKLNSNDAHFTFTIDNRFDSTYDQTTYDQTMSESSKQQSQGKDMIYAN